MSVSLAGELSISPPAATVTTKLLGQTLTITQVGGSLYVREPSIARRDGGRPWIKEDQQGSSQLFNSNPTLGSGTGLGGSGSGSARPAARRTSKASSRS